MAVEFEVEFNVQTSKRGGYRSFIQNLRVRLGVRSSHNRPALAVQEEPPTRFFELILRTNDHSVRFRLRMDNLYLIGYQMEGGQWLEFDNEAGTHLIQNSSFLRFSGSYGSLASAAHQTVEGTRVGFQNIVNAINQLATSTNGETRARRLIVVIMMICESVRLIPVLDYMANSFDSTEGEIQGWIMDLVRSWDPFSSAVLRADAYPSESFQLRRNDVRIPPDNREIRTIAQVVEIIGILLGLCFRPSGPRRFPRMAVDNDDKCFLGVPLVEVFSVRIDNIDGEDPGDLYGTITVNDGLNTQYIYNRTSDNPESVKPNQNASLTGPYQSISAFGSFNMKLLLTDKDTWSWDDVIVDGDILWDARDIGNKYDQLISQKLEGKNGAVTVNYAVLRNAVAARVTINLQEGGESPVEVYGRVSANYDNWDDPNTTSLLFNKSKDDYVSVRRWQNIPLLRSVVAVPLENSLKITASLYDYDTISADDEIANGTVEFPAQMSGTSSKSISGEDGNWVTVTVSWSFDIYEEKNVTSGEEGRNGTSDHVHDEL